MMPRILLLAAFFAGAPCAQIAGDRPSALVWDKLKGDCPAKLDWTSLRGKVVVLAFSDSYFPGDLADWSALVKEFQSSPALFVQVASGAEFLLDRALQSAAHPGCVLWDGEVANRARFGLPTRLRFPRTVVVDELGVIAGYSREPDAKAIQAVLDHCKETTLSVTPPQPSAAVEDPAPEPSFAVHIRPASQPGFKQLGALGPDRYIARHQPLAYIVSDLWDTPLARISLPENFGETSYDIDARIPAGGQETLIDLVRQAIEQHFGLQIIREVCLTRLYLLTAASTRTGQLRPAAKEDIPMTGSSVDGDVIGTARTPAEIARSFEAWLRAPVIDETGFEGKFNYAAATSLDGLPAALEIARQLGLELTPAERPVEMLVVRKRR
jgi:uncharacterized protein (TIGR03435 family)